MGSTQDDSLLTKTFDFISNKARDQDLILFFPALAKNYKARRMLTKYIVQDEYEQASIPLATTSRKDSNVIKYSCANDSRELDCLTLYFRWVVIIQEGELLVLASHLKIGGHIFLLGEEGLQRYQSLLQGKSSFIQVVDLCS